MLIDVRTELVTPDYAGALHHGVALHVWRRRVNVETVAAARRFIQPWDDRIHAVLAVIEEGSTFPDEATRTALGTLHRESGLVFVAVVYEGKNFKSAAVRAIVTGIHLMRPTPYQTKVFGSVPEAMIWLERVHGSMPGVADLEGFVSDLRHGLDTRVA